MNGFGPGIAVDVLGLPHAHDRAAGIHVFIHKGFGHFVNGFALLLGPFEVFVEHVAVGCPGSVHTAESGDCRGHADRQVGPAGTDPDGAHRGWGHGVFQEDPHLVLQHLLFRFRGNPVLKEDEHGIVKRIPLFGQIAQVVTPHDGFFFGFVGNRGFSSEQWLASTFQGLAQGR
jgi:hypothetical protein